ncbi:hypothetical protein SB57_03605 [Lactobacillus delbrueckii subsp. bulgaricus]|nr:hypothetical protein SB57_03605 [Lactobacillus delbrueckii subsp. bulgaricus]
MVKLILELHHFIFSFHGQVIRQDKDHKDIPVVTVFHIPAQSAQMQNLPTLSLDPVVQEQALVRIRIPALQLQLDGLLRLHKVCRINKVIIGNPFSIQRHKLQQSGKPCPSCWKSPGNKRQSLYNHTHTF